MNFIQYDSTDRQIQETAKSLGLSDKSKRLEARRSLEAAGKRAVLILIEALLNGNNLARKEAADALAYIKEPSSAGALVVALEDEDHDVRWAAMKAIIALDQDGVESLLLALIKDFSSAYLREGARHILNTMRQNSCLESPILPVLKALEGIQPAATVPWALKRPGKSCTAPRKKGDRYHYRQFSLPL